MTRPVGRLSPARLELLALVALIALAALTRLPGLEERGRWDADQGHDMLVLRALVSDGEVPLLGPVTSIGTFHHGAVYYYLLAPAALASGADPVAVTAWIALWGIGAVAGTWWLARLAGGPLAGLAAGLLAAVSPAGIDESTFIWNPNLVPLAAALAFAGLLRARRPGGERWWLLAGLGAMVAMQCHVLGAVIVPPLVVAWTMDVRGRRAAGGSARALGAAGLGAAAIIAAGYLPLAVHELQTGFTETRAILDYLGGGGRSAGAGLLDTIALVGTRAVTWPFTGLLIDRPALSLATGVTAGALAAVAIASGADPDRRAARWLLGTLAWSVLALAIFAPSLATIVRGLPNDHYHAFLDPLVLALAGIGLARAAQKIRVPRVRSGAAAVMLAVLVAVEVIAWPPRLAEDGGWRAVDDAAVQVLAVTGDTPVLLAGIPPFKSADALRFPLERHGARVVGDPQDRSWDDAVVVCDPLFDQVVGAACGGPAEEAWARAGGGLPGLRLVTRIEAGTRRVISVYQRAAAP